MVDATVARDQRLIRQTESNCQPRALLGRSQRPVAHLVEIAAVRTSFVRSRMMPDRNREEFTVQYMLLIHASESTMHSASEDDTAKTHAAYMAYTEAMSAAGAMVAGNRLRPTSAATTVRIVDGKTQVVDGPYAETKEQLAGYYLIEVSDLDAALGWAARCPGASRGAIEVRPVWQM
jgi:hypothetical protein